MRLPSMRFDRFFLALWALLLGLGQPELTQAIDNFWTGNLNDSWNIVNNWKFMGQITPLPRVPADSDTAVLSSPANDTVRLYGNTAPINGLIVGNGIGLFTNGFQLQVDNAGLANTSIAGGARITVDPRVGGTAFQTDQLLLLSFGTLTLNHGEAQVEGDTTMFSGSQINGSGGGDIQFDGNVSLDNSVLRLLNRTSASFGANTTMLAKTGSIVDLEQQVNVIDGMSFDFRSGSRLEVMSLNIGNNGSGAGSNATLMLDGAGTATPRVDVDLDLTIGHATNGTGLLDMKQAIASITGRTTVLPTGTIQLESTQFAALGGLLVDGGTITSVNESNPIFLPVGGKVTATNGGFVSVAGNQEIRANGTFEFFSGADLAVTGTLTVGGDLASSDTFTIDGAGSTFDVGVDLIVGDAQQQGTVGLSMAAAGTVTGKVDIGADGTGALTIGSGATLSGNVGQLGVTSASSGTVTVSGGGSTWNNSGTLSIGSSGSGQLNILAGGQVFSAAGFIAADTNSQGVVTVGGAGAAWTINGGLSVGGGALAGIGGDATLNIQSGGAVNVETSLVVHTNDLLQLTGGALTVQTIDLQGGQFNWTAGILHAEMSQDDIVNQGGRLAPGKASIGQEIGLTTIDGKYTQQAGAVLEIEIGGLLPVSQYDQVSVTGVALLGGELQLSLANNYFPGSSDTFTVLSALSGIAGVFANITSGQRLDTVDGAGSFLVHYGPGSAFDPSMIVLSDFLSAFTADFDLDGDVDADDLTQWQGDFGPNANSDADGDGDSDGFDFLTWQQQFGSGAPLLAASRSVPEPEAVQLTLFAVVLWMSYGFFCQASTSGTRRLTMTRTAESISTTLRAATVRPRL